MSLAAAVPSRSINAAPRLISGVESATQPSNFVSSMRVEPTFEQKITDALVGLKAATSAYAMHITSDAMENIFAQLEDVINLDDWHEEDEFPRLQSFKDLLAWSIYAGVQQWDSLGVDDDGDVLVAWYSEQITLTANFDGHRLVRWTSRYQDGDDVVAHASGDCSLRQFAKQARFYLLGEANNG